jgi:transposase
MTYEKVPREKNKNRIRKGFNLNGGVICKGCFDKKLQIDLLKEELRRCKEKINRMETPQRNKTPDDSHEPSSRKRFKKNSKEENQKKKGGAKKGHKGFGRRQGSEAPEQTESELPCECPECHVSLSPKDTKNRTIVEVHKIKAKRTVFGLKRNQCPKCRKIYQGSLNCFQRALYGNRLLAQASVMHYLHGIPIGKVLEILGPEVTEGGIIQAFHRIGLICHLARTPLIQEFRSSYLKQADETGWRTDGCGGYAWAFITPRVTLLEFRNTRSSQVPNEIFGCARVKGVLVVDRYNGYNKLNVKIQYCYAHLLREVESLEKEFPESSEIKTFCSLFGDLLAKAMKLQRLNLSPDKHLKKARQIKKKMLIQIETNYAHLGIRRIQNIFYKCESRMYHWVSDPRIPAHNNGSEREIRPTVLARKTSFGSQSARGARTRSSIMSILFTAKKRLKNLSVEDWFYDSLNKISQNPNLKIYDLLPTPPP